MVEIKTIRTSRIEDGVAIATRIEEFENGVGKKVKRTIEEIGITLDEVREVNDKLIVEELEKVNTERVKLMTEMTEMQEEIKDIVTTREYKKFKIEIESDAAKKYFDALKKEGIIKKAIERLKELNRIEDDVKAWEVQMKELQSKIENK